MSVKCRMRRINAGVQNRNFDRPVWSDASVNLMCQRQLNFFRGPLRYESSVVTTNTPGVTDAPGVADAPGIALTNRRLRNEIRFNKNDTRILSQRVYSLFD